MVLTTVRGPSAITIRKVWGKKVLLPMGPGEHMAPLGPHGEVLSGREEEKEREWTWRTAFIGVKDGGLGLQRYMLY